MKRSVRVKRAGVQLPVKAVVVESRNSWSKVIHSWIAEFRRDQTKSLRSFDSLFKNKLPNTDDVE